MTALAIRSRRAVRDVACAAVGPSPHSGRRSRAGEELTCVPILEAQPAGEPGVLRAAADVDALRRIEPVSLDEDHAESGQWLSTPADWRASAVRTIQNVHRDAEPLLYEGMAAYLDMTQPYAAGSLYSTVEDLYRWDQALLTEKILSAKSKERMFSPGLSDYG
jgi:hypothetical protein